MGDFGRGLAGGLAGAVRPEVLVPALLQRRAATLGLRRQEAQRKRVVSTVRSAFEGGMLTKKQALEIILNLGGAEDIGWLTAAKPKRGPKVPIPELVAGVLAETGRPPRRRAVPGVPGAERAVAPGVPSRLARQVAGTAQLAGTAAALPFRALEVFRARRPLEALRRFGRTEAGLRQAYRAVTTPAPGVQPVVGEEPFDPVTAARLLEERRREMIRLGKPEEAGLRVVPPARLPLTGAIPGVGLGALFGGF